MPPQQGEGLRGGTRPSPSKRQSGSCRIGPFSHYAFSRWKDGEVGSQTKPSVLQVGMSQQGRGKSCLTTVASVAAGATMLKTPILLPIAAQNQSCPTRLPFQNRLSSALLLLSLAQEDMLQHPPAHLLEWTGLPARVAGHALLSTQYSSLVSFPVSETAL